MSRLYYEDYVISSAEIGKESSLPSLEGLLNVQQRSQAVLDEDDEMYVGYGFLSNIFPYRQQDVYDRTLSRKCYKSWILENDFLRARFLPELGGRLISLLDKKTGKDLLFSNRELYVGNLALRNSWFSGGVEWNVSIIGHSPFTCSPLHTARTSLEDGTPVLRMYEYERLRGVTYQMDFFLPEASPFLLARMRMVNESGQTIPAYWWSNIAVPEWKKGRVVVPADAAYENRDGVVIKDSVPVDHAGTDVTYPVNNPVAIDHFWKIPSEKRKYIAHLNEEGWGLVQTSTRRQRGRKLFVWGQGPGGNRWQAFLSGNEEQRYVEIQAGVGQSQYECVPMAPCTAWEWMEAYGAMQADPKAVHGEWLEARREVEERLDAVLPEERLEEILAATRDTMAKQPAGELLLSGSGWGALENARRECSGKKALSSHLDFGEPGEEQKQWLTLLEEGSLGSHEPGEVPPSWTLDAEDIRRMEAAAARGEADWYLWMQLGVSRLASGEKAGARQALEQSLSMAENPWARYALSCLCSGEGKGGEACGHAMAAMKDRPEDLSLAKKCLARLISCEKYREALEWIETMPMALPGRISFLKVQALTGLGRYEEAETLLLSDGGLIVPDVREGELSLSAAWSKIQEGKAKNGGEALPVPDALDFRMHQANPPRSGTTAHETKEKFHGKTA